MGFSGVHILALVPLLFLCPVVQGWGVDGHLTVCEIAQSRLSETAADAVKDLLPAYAEDDLGSLCSWADRVKFRYHWSSPLHFIDTPDDLCTYNYNRDCRDENGTLGSCVAGAINNYTTQLLSYGNENAASQCNNHSMISYSSSKFRDKSSTDKLLIQWQTSAFFLFMAKIFCCSELPSILDSPTKLLIFVNKSEATYPSLVDSNQSFHFWSMSSDNLTEALLFLSHFVGDIHQPLHVGFTSDKGGNTIDVHWFTRKSVLHHVWDDNIIETSEERFYDSNVERLIDALKKNITGEWADQVENWEACSNNKPACPDVYATESIKAACNWAYKGVQENSVLEDDYFLTRLPIANLRLAQGGVRLAAILNRIFGS